MLRPFREGIHLERLSLRKPATSDPSTIPSGNPTSRTLFRLLLSSISVIFSVSRSSWFLKSVTALLSSRAVAWTESTLSRVCFAAPAMASNSSLSSLTELLVACMSSRSLRNAGNSISYCRSHNRIQSALLLYKCQLDTVSNSIVDILSGDQVKSSQVELYCHSAACGDIQWNEMSCLTGPRCYINTDIQHYKPIHKLTYWQIWLDILYINVYPIQLKDKDRKYKLYNLFTLNVYPIQLKIKIKNTNYTNYANASHKYCTCAERNIVSQQLAGEQYKMICSGAWACKHTYIAESFVGLCTHSVRKSV